MTGTPSSIQTLLNTTNVTSTTTSNTIQVSSTEHGVGIAASWTTATPAAVTFDSGTKAALTISDLTYTADSIGTAGNSITVEYLDATKASAVIQDLTYTADTKGTGGNAITVAYATGGSAGNEVVSVVGNAISVAIQDSASYSTKTFTSGTLASGTIQDITYKVKTAFAAIGNNAKVAYVGGGFGSQEASVRSGSGTAGDPYIVTVTIQGSDEYTTKTFNAGAEGTALLQGLTFTQVVRNAAQYIQVDIDGGGTAGAESVTLSGLGTAIDPYKILIVVEAGVSTTAQVKTAYDLVGAVTAIATVAITTPGTVSGTISTPLSGGSNSSIDVTNNTIDTGSHGYLDGTRVRFTTPSGSLPSPLVVGTDYWVRDAALSTFKVTDSWGGAAVNITDQGTSGVVFSVVPYATRASEIDTAVGADANSTALLARTVVTAAAAEATQIATSLTGGVASPIDQTAETITVPTHGYTTGNKVTITGAALPANLVSPAWVTVVDGSTLKFATSYANAMSSTNINIASDGVESTLYTITPAYSTATQVKAAVDASVAAAALVDVSITGTAGNNQQINAGTSLANGFGGTAGNEEVVVTGTAIKVYIETGVSTANQVKTAVNAKAAATALIDLTGAGVTAQVVTAAAPLATGTDNDFTKSTETNPNRITILTHGLATGSKVALTTGGSLPTGLAAQDYYAIYIDANTIKLASSVLNAQAGTAVAITGDGTGAHQLTPAATTAAIKVQWSVDNVIFEDVPSGLGGESVDMTSTTVNLWSINNVVPEYYRVVITQTAGLIPTLLIKYITK